MATRPLRGVASQATPLVALPPVEPAPLVRPREALLPAPRLLRTRPVAEAAESTRLLPMVTLPGPLASLCQTPPPVRETLGVMLVAPPIVEPTAIRAVQPGALDPPLQSPALEGDPRREVIVRVTILRVPGLRLPREAAVALRAAGTAALRPPPGNRL